MVESIGICEKHLLPLDEAGECELCRLSEMPSKAPPARSAWWAVIVPSAILLLGAVLTYFAILSDDAEPPQQGVQAVAPAVAPEEPAPEETAPEEPAPEEPALEEPALEEPAPEEPAPEEPSRERGSPGFSLPSAEEIPTPDDFKQ